MFEFFLGFILGATTGVAFFMWYGLRQMKKLDKVKEEFVTKFKKKAEELENKMNGVKDRMEKVKELTKKQLALMSAIDEPSKNALHSKYKNELNSEVRSIEEEKALILRSILQDGFDPTVTILNKDNQKESIKLSEYMSKNGVPTDVPPAPPTDGGKRIGKFVVYSGGNDDTTH